MSWIGPQCEQKDRFTVTALRLFTSHTNIILSEQRATARMFKLSKATAMTSANFVWLFWAILILLLPAIMLVEPSGGGLLRLTRCCKLSVANTRIMPSEHAQNSCPPRDWQPNARGTLMFIHLSSLRCLSKTQMWPSAAKTKIFGTQMVIPTKICSFTLARSADTDSRICQFSPY